MREAGLSNRFVCQSVVCLSVCKKKIEISHIDPHKPSKGSQTIANSTKMLYVYLTEVKGASFRCISAVSYFSKHWLHLFVTSESHQEHAETSCFEMTTRKQYFPAIYVLHRLRDYCLRCHFQLFPIIRSIWPHLFSFTICTLYIR